MHHFYADPIILIAPTSSAGCAITDALIALWFLARAPSVYANLRGNAPSRAAAIRRAKSLVNDRADAGTGRIDPSHDSP